MHIARLRCLIAIYVELRREQKKFQEKLSNHMDTRNRAMQDNKKTSDQQIDLLSKINSDLNAQ